MARDVLLDTGPLVAVLDARDPWHARCLEEWPALITRCVTTEAVVTEASHLVMRGRARAVTPLQFLLQAAIPILGLDTAGQHRAAALMARYTAVPMDYADATLVAVGEALRIANVFTTDRRGFVAYRLPHGKRFHLTPE